MRKRYLAIALTSLLSLGSVANANAVISSGTDSGNFVIGTGTNHVIGVNAIGIGSTITSTGVSTIAIGDKITIEDSRDPKTNKSNTYGIAIGSGSEIGADSGNGIVIGHTATIGAKSTNGIAIGINSNVAGSSGIAIGDTAATNNGGSNVAIGASAAAAASATAVGFNSNSSNTATAIGTQANANGDSSTAIGFNSASNGYGAIANGANTAASGQQSVATGFESNATGIYATAVGTISKAQGDFSLALGARSQATAKEAIAIGDNSKATLPGGVALGAGSITDRTTNPQKVYLVQYPDVAATVAHTLSPVSVGYDQGVDNAGKKVEYTRQIKHVAAGEDPSDAVNVAQLKHMSSTNMTVINNRINTSGALSAAMAQIHPLAYDQKQPTQFLLGYGHYHNKNAVAFGLSHYTKESSLYTISYAMSSGEHMLGASASWKLGKRPKDEPKIYQQGPLTSIYVLQQQVASLLAANQALEKKVAELSARL